MDAFWSLRCWDYQQYCLLLANIAESVLHIYEKRYPDDNRIRACIEGVKKYAKNEITLEQLKELKAYTADAAADAAADATAAYAAYAAAAAADADATAAYAAYAAAYAADAADADADVLPKERIRIKRNIINYGITLLSVS